MFAILAVIAFAAAFFEHWGKVSASAPLDQTGLLYLGLALLAIHLVRRHGPANWRTG